MINMTDTTDQTFVILQVRGNDTWHDYAQIDTTQADKFMASAVASGSGDSWRIRPSEGK